MPSAKPRIARVPLPPGFDDPFPLFRETCGDFRRSFYLDSYNAGALGRYSYFPLSEPRRVYAAKGLGEFMRAWKALRDELPAFAGSSSLPPPFAGGAVGLLSYDCGRVFERGWRTPPPPDPLRFPWMSFGVYDDLFCFDHRARRAYALQSGPGSASSTHRLAESLGRKSARLRPRRPADFAALKPPAFTSSRLRSFTGSVRKIKDYIAAGDIYQANFSQRFEFPYEGTGLDYFERLRRVNPSPYAFYFRTGDFEVASCSPELLLKKRGDLLETRPIAGTRPRGRSRAADRRLEGELLLSAKERAEHVMLVDLERNDLSRVCRPGTVRVSEKMIVEKYSHVMHIVSCVRGRMRKGSNLFEALEAVFPGGTITGCPKARSMEILDELEPVRRGPFYGSFGWIGANGDCEMNLMIRTALVSRSRRRLWLQAGSGIVADSDPVREYRESIHKARALLSALGSRA